jgi:hypothetical protein
MRLIGSRMRWVLVGLRAEREGLEDVGRREKGQRGLSRREKGQRR